MSYLTPTFDELQATLRMIDSNQENLLQSAGVRIRTYREQVSALERELAAKRAGVAQLKDPGARPAPRKRPRIEEAPVRSVERAPSLTFDNVFENSAVAIIFVYNRRILCMNRRFLDLFGWSLGELVGRQMTQLSHPDDDPCPCSTSRKMPADRPQFFPKRTLTRAGAYASGLIMPLTIRGGRDGRHLFSGAILFDDRELGEACDAQAFFSRTPPEHTVCHAALDDIVSSPILLPSPSALEPGSEASVWTPLLPSTPDDSS
jgi:PAS domain S-box-containing protein